MLTIIIQREPEAKSTDDRIGIGHVLSVINRDKTLKRMLVNGQLKLVVTKRQLGENA